MSDFIIPEIINNGTLSWLVDANCKDADPSLFFGNSSKNDPVARKLCSECKVIKNCFKQFGQLPTNFVAGLTAKERKHLSAEEQWELVLSRNPHARADD